MIFRWIHWNVDKCDKHGISIDEAEYVVNYANRAYPRRIDDQKLLVRGQAGSGRYIQVIYLLERDNTAFVIHARPLNETEKRSLRRSRK